MAKLIFDAVGKRLYETGIRDVVLFVKNEDGTYQKGVAWNGITAISESPEGAEPNAIYADDMKYLNLLSLEEFNASVEAYNRPDEFMPCDGIQEILEGFRFTNQHRSEFALCYRTTIGNDVKGNDHGYKLHVVYGCLAAPSESAYNTINDSPEAISFSWEISTTPLDCVIGGKNYKVSHLELDSTKFVTDADKAKFKEVENRLYGANAYEIFGTSDVTNVFGTDASSNIIGFVGFDNNIKIKGSFRSGEKPGLTGDTEQSVVLEYSSSGHCLKISFPNFVPAETGISFDRSIEIHFTGIQDHDNEHIHVYDIVYSDGSVMTSDNYYFDGSIIIKMDNSSTEILSESYFEKLKQLSSFNDVDSEIVLPNEIYDILNPQEPNNSPMLTFFRNPAPENNAPEPEEEVQEDPENLTEE